MTDLTPNQINALAVERPEIETIPDAEYEAFERRCSSELMRIRASAVGVEIGEVRGDG